MATAALAVAPSTSSRAAAEAAWLERDHALRERGLSAAAREVVRHALALGDARGRPFAVVDKHRARLYLFRGDGQIAGIAPALLGLTAGDRAYAGYGANGGTIPVHERTTPAGRYDSEPGRNLFGEAIVWVDYEASLAIHRLRPAPAGERRPQRLASATPGDNRISLGCVIVDVGFYETVVAPLLGRQRGVVYILPDGKAGELPWLAADQAAE